MVDIIKSFKFAVKKLLSFETDTHVSFFRKFHSIESFYFLFQSLLPFERVGLVLPRSASSLFYFLQVCILKTQRFTHPFKVKIQNSGENNSDIRKSELS